MQVDGKRGTSSEGPPTDGGEKEDFEKKKKKKSLKEMNESLPLLDKHQSKGKGLETCGTSILTTPTIREL